MTFNYLPNEIKEKIFLYAMDYTPALKMVSKLWREITSYSGFNKRISFKDLVRRGDVDLLIDLHKRKEKGYNCSLLIYAAFYGREELCHLAKRWGESNFEGMLYVATKAGHKNICQIAKAWGAKGIDDDLPSELTKVGSGNFYPPLSRFWDDYNFELFYDDLDEDLQSIVKGLELNDAILLFNVRNNLKTGKVYITINKWVDEETWKKRMQKPKPRDVWSYGNTIVITY